MIVLGIESSCDETGVSIVENGRKILSNVVATSLAEHSKYGGVIPEIASRMQLEAIAGVCDQAFQQAGLKFSQIDLIGVTNQPGLPGSLLIGLSFAKALSLGLNKPLIGINHVYSHFYANFLCHKGIKFPFVALVASGGHTNLFYVKDFIHIKPIGQTQDDACGEAFDKVAKLLELGYPGGPIIEKMAKGVSVKKNKFAIPETRNALNFSFSGLKTAVMYYLKDKCQVPGLKSHDTLTQKKELAASFQETAIQSLIKNSLLAVRLKKVRDFLVGGGVAANSVLREELSRAMSNEGVHCYFPPINLCMDNAAMVAGLAYQMYKKGVRDNLYLNVEFN